MDKGAEMACDTRETKISHEVGVWLNMKSLLPKLYYLTLSQI